MPTGPKAEYSRGAGRGILAGMTSPDSPLIRVGLLGAGTVGATLLGLIGSRPGLGLRPTRALVRDLARPRTVARPQELLTTDPEEVLDNCDLLVEVMGGTGLAVELMLRALGRGLPVVTANKAALAERWDAFEPYIRGGRVHFEAAVMAGTPIVGSLSRALRGSQPLELHAILNGTCNYILGQLELGIDYAEALAEAQRLGFTEADPSLDVEGYDAAHKLTLLARLAFTPEAAWDEVSAATQGIAHLTPAIVREAMEDGGRVRLVGSVSPRDGRWQLAVRPVYLPADHPLISASGGRNGLLFRGDPVGEVMISGRGAGGGPTASALLADVIAAARGLPGPSPLLISAPVPADHRPEDLGELRRG